MRKIYFGEQALLVYDPAETDAGDGTPEVSDKLSLQHALTQLSGSGKRSLSVTDRSGAPWPGPFGDHFRLLFTGGGLVTDPRGDVLLIFRRGVWDLPKGKLDEGETIPECALREVREETGLKNVRLESPLIVTYHTYQEKGRSVLKENHWFRMTADEDNLQPQLEEDIERCEWVPVANLDEYTKSTHPSIRDVVQAFRQSAGY